MCVCLHVLLRAFKTIFIHPFYLSFFISYFIGLLGKDFLLSFWPIQIPYLNIKHTFSNIRKRLRCSSNIYIYFRLFSFFKHLCISKLWLGKETKVLKCPTRGCFFQVFWTDLKQKIEEACSCAIFIQQTHVQICIHSVGYSSKRNLSSVIIYSLHYS